ncbi:hypothetical protein HDV05_005623 [Chytridiales sp. JEL 0842]|nr:hypothetical protein HDV05_005623 [Chytridiales sp. JEL 0842]
MQLAGVIKEMAMSGSGSPYAFIQELLKEAAEEVEEQQNSISEMQMGAEKKQKKPAKVPGSRINIPKEKQDIVFLLGFLRLLLLLEADMANKEGLKSNELFITTIKNAASSLKRVYDRDGNGAAVVDEFFFKKVPHFLIENWCDEGNEKVIVCLRRDWAKLEMFDASSSMRAKVHQRVKDTAISIQHLLSKVTPHPQDPSTRSVPSQPDMEAPAETLITITSSKACDFRRSLVDRLRTSKDLKEDDEKREWAENAESLAFELSGAALKGQTNVKITDSADAIEVMQTIFSMFELNGKLSPSPAEEKSKLVVAMLKSFANGIRYIQSETTIDRNNLLILAANLEGSIFFELKPKSRQEDGRKRSATGEVVSSAPTKKKKLGQNEMGLQPPQTTETAVSVVPDLTTKPKKKRGKRFLSHIETRKKTVLNQFEMVAVALFFDKDIVKRMKELCGVDDIAVSALLGQMRREVKGRMKSFFSNQKDKRDIKLMVKDHEVLVTEDSGTFCFLQLRAHHENSFVTLNNQDYKLYVLSACEKIKTVPLRPAKQSFGNYKVSRNDISTYLRGTSNLGSSSATASPTPPPDTDTPSALTSKTLPSKIGTSLATASFIPSSIVDTKWYAEFKKRGKKDAATPPPDTAHTKSVNRYTLITDFVIKGQVFPLGKAVEICWPVAGDFENIDKHRNRFRQILKQVVASFDLAGGALSFRVEEEGGALKCDFRLPITRFDPSCNPQPKSVNTSPVILPGHDPPAASAFCSRFSHELNPENANCCSTPAPTPSPPKNSNYISPSTPSTADQHMPHTIESKWERIEGFPDTLFCRPLEPVTPLPTKRIAGFEFGLHPVLGIYDNDGWGILVGNETGRKIRQLEEIKQKKQSELDKLIECDELVAEFKNDYDRECDAMREAIAGGGLSQIHLLAMGKRRDDAFKRLTNGKMKVRESNPNCRDLQKYLDTIEAKMKKVVMRLHDLVRRVILFRGYDQVFGSKLHVKELVQQETLAGSVKSGLQRLALGKLFKSIQTLMAKKGGAFVEVNESCSTKYFPCCQGYQMDTGAKKSLTCRNCRRFWTTSVNSTVYLSSLLLGNL